MRVAEVTEIRFASLDLVCVAAQCLNEITKECESEKASAGAPNADVSASCHDDKKTVTNQSTSQDEDEIEDAKEEVTDKEVTHEATANQCATVQRQSQSTSTVAASTHDATASMNEKSGEDLKI